MIHRWPALGLLVLVLATIADAQPQCILQTGVIGGSTGGGTFQFVSCPSPLMAGVGACPAGQYVSELNPDAGPTCSTPAGGSGAPSDGEYVTYASNAALSAERVLTSGTNTTVDLSVSGQARVNFSGTIGNASISDLATSKLTGTITNAQLASSYSGVGACGGGTFVSTINANAAPTCTAAGSDPWTRVVTTGDTANSTTTPTAVTGLTLAVAASTNYVVRCQLVTSAAAATTGVQLTLTGPASPTALTWTRRSCSSTTAIRAFQSNSYNADAATASAGTTRCIDEVLVTLRNGSNAGTLGFNLASEVAASAATVHIGSWCERITF